MVVTNRDDARIVNMSFLHQDRQRPPSFVGNGKAGRTVPVDSPSCDVFEDMFRPSDVCPEQLRGLGRDQFMAVAVRRHFVAGGRDVLDEAGMPLCDPPSTKNVARV